jgi:hypothetical protein
LITNHTDAAFLEAVNELQDGQRSLTRQTIKSPNQYRFELATAPAWKAYQEATATAWKAYQEAKAPALTEALLHMKLP